MAIGPAPAATPHRVQWSSGRAKTKPCSRLKRCSAQLLPTHHMHTPCAYPGMLSDTKSHIPHPAAPGESGVCFVFLTQCTQAEQTQQPRNPLPTQASAPSAGHNQMSPHTPLSSHPQARVCPHRSEDSHITPRHTDPHAESKAVTQPHPKHIPSLGCVHPRGSLGSSPRAPGSPHSWTAPFALPATADPPHRAHLAAVLHSSRGWALGAGAESGTLETLGSPPWKEGGRRA